MNRVKGLTAIILKDTPDEKDLPKMERREGQDWIGLRIRHKGKITDLYINQLADGRLMHSNSWIMPDGWMTDAYMFVRSGNATTMAASRHPDHRPLVTSATPEPCGFLTCCGCLCFLRVAPGGVPG